MVWRLCNVAYNGSRRQRRISTEDRAMIFSLTPQCQLTSGDREVMLDIEEDEEESIENEKRPEKEEMENV